MLLFRVHPFGCHEKEDDEKEVHRYCSEVVRYRILSEFFKEDVVGFTDECQRIADEK